MCNLGLLYYAAHHTGKKELSDMATKHALKLLKSLVRADLSTSHLVNFDAKTGVIKEQLTNQGYQNWSTWSRGQAWGILGYAQTYLWTRDVQFLDTAVSLANYFLSQLESATHPNPYVPLWNFDAPNETLLRESSAGMIAANGLLILYQSLHGRGEGNRSLSAVIRIAKDTIDLSLSQKKSVFLADKGGGTVASSGGFEAILQNATACRHEHSLRQYYDHGLVYADYYSLEFGNRLLQMGML